MDRLCFFLLLPPKHFCQKQKKCFPNHQMPVFVSSVNVLKDYHDLTKKNTNFDYEEIRASV